ncbi:cysteine desulfurase family protein [Flavobacterium selenitireducens]|uniref:cysteine desulfurase family protein n=1 Tax=Flavobacterium selenitireducens TaxID=2722704 RepID=UPI00168AB54C|nr:cysteine desulfurase family protein [Flavobacterium selenitireducens]MBD3581450.1 cysteine desulfurase [Flavobacterium selenitireducens]
MNTVYLDNAATTQLRPEVVAEIAKVLSEDFGNPSSTHSFGRHAKGVIETARKSIASNLGCLAQEIVFTSGATEANNWIIKSAISDFKVERIITTKIEHHAVLETVEHLGREFSIDVQFLNIANNGEVDLSQLEALLAENVPTLVTLMHVNNEVGTVLDLVKVGNLCRQYNAYFHSDTVQSIGKAEFDLKQLPIDFAVASAHKFHGPKGIGFAYIRKGLIVNPMMFGGEQEKGIRPGTEGVHNIAGMAKALELSYSNLSDERSYIAGLKAYAVTSLTKAFGEIKVNGSAENGFYNILNVCLPMEEQKALMILFNLDMRGIALSRGSACQSGSAKPSHVLAEMLADEDIRKPSLRISFSHYNSKADIDVLIEALKTI